MVWTKTRPQSPGEAQIICQLCSQQKFLTGQEGWSLQPYLEGVTPFVSLWAPHYGGASKSTLLLMSLCNGMPSQHLVIVLWCPFCTASLHTLLSYCCILSLSACQGII